MDTTSVSTDRTANFSGFPSVNRAMNYEIIGLGEVNSTDLVDVLRRIWLKNERFSRARSDQCLAIGDPPR